MYYESKAQREQLVPYIKNYLQVMGKAVRKGKDVLARPGASLIMDVDGLLFNRNIKLNKALVGFHGHSYHFESEVEERNSFSIRFSAYGLSRFTTIPQDELSNRVVDAETVFGNALKEGYEALWRTNDPQQRLEQVEAFLLGRLKVPDAIEQTIFQLADLLAQEHEPVSFERLRKNIPLSTRQLERRFKTLTGADLQTYIRICRFDHAQSLLQKESSGTLTHIGLQAGYYDQSHFSHEFKKFAQVSPKNFEPCSPALLETGNSAAE